MKTRQSIREGALGMRQHGMTRRRFIELVPALLVVAPVVREIAALTGPPAAHGLAEVFGHAREAARAIGLRYLSQTPEDHDRDALAERILASVSNEAIDALPLATLRSKFQQRFASDFDRGETVLIDGWVLSRTEVRLCALLALS